LSGREHAELVAAKRRIRQLETELAIVRQACALYEELKGDPKSVPGNRAAGAAHVTG
jgi:hypothetical protein